MPDFRLQTIDCEAIIVGHLTSCCSRLPYGRQKEVFSHQAKVFRFSNMSLDVTRAYMDVLQNIEFSIVSFFHQNPELKDPDVIRSTEALISVYTREKKRLPVLPITLSEKNTALFDAMKAACERRLTRESVNPVTDPHNGDALPLRLMIICLERLLLSMNRWHKLNGMRGYLNYVDNFIK
jgi:hypothetical protein